MAHRCKAFFFLCLLLPSAIFGIVFSDREFVLNPLANSFGDLPDNRFQFLSADGLYGEFSKYLPEPWTDADHSWKSKVGGFFEFFRSGNSLDVFISSEIELIADPISPIYFYPHSFYWSEGLILSKKEDLFTWQTGYYHRCKHDVENLRFNFSQDTAEQRGIIYDSVPYRMIFNPITWYKSKDGPFRLESLFYSKNDLYVLLQDSMILYPTFLSNASTPEKLSAEGLNNVESIIDSITLGAHTTFYFSEILGVYLNAQCTVDFYGRDTGWMERFRQLGHVNTDVFLELGFFVQNKDRFCLYLSVERQQDTLVHPYPTDSMLYYMGVKCFNPGYYQ